MDEIFARAKNILVVWPEEVDPINLPNFQGTVETKAKQAHIASENVQTLLKSQHATSSFDLIIFGLVSEKNTPTSIDLLNEFFRLLRPNGYLITHIEHIKQAQAVDHFKMCGFDSCNQLDSNSSFLIEHKDDDVKKLGSLWLCQKPSFDIGYSVPLRTTGVRLMRQISSATGGLKKSWTVEGDDSTDTDDFGDEDGGKQPDVKNYDCDTTSSGAQKACKNCTCGLAQELEHTAANQTIKSSCESCNLDDAFRSAGGPARALPPSKPGEHVTFPTMSDV